MSIFHYFISTQEIVPDFQNGVLFPFRFIPESARWLLTKNRNEEAIELLLKVAKENKVSITAERIQELLDQDDDAPETGKEMTNMESGTPLMNKETALNGVDHNAEEDKDPQGTIILANGVSDVERKPEETSNPSVLDLFRYPNLRKKSLNIFFSW